MPKAKSAKNADKLWQQNLRQSKIIAQKIDNLEKEIRKIEIVSMIRFLIVAVPLILAILYLIPLFRHFLSIYKPILDILNDLQAI